jgi:hypothetical protein
MACMRLPCTASRSESPARTSRSGVVVSRYPIVSATGALSRGMCLLSHALPGGRAAVTTRRLEVLVNRKCHSRFEKIWRIMWKLSKCHARNEECCYDACPVTGRTLPSVRMLEMRGNEVGLRFATTRPPQNRVSVLHSRSTFTLHFDEQTNFLKLTSNLQLAHLEHDVKSIPHIAASSYQVIRLLPTLSSSYSRMYTSIAPCSRHAEAAQQPPRCNQSQYGIVYTVYDTGALPSCNIKSERRNATFQRPSLETNELCVKASPSAPFNY